MLAGTLAILIGATSISFPSRNIERADNTMNKPKLLAAVMAFGVLV
jgi:hypothetical protein